MNEDQSSEKSVTPNTIVNSLIKNMIDNYKKNQLAVINKELNMSDSHSIWFDLPTLKKLIADVESETKKIDPNITDKELGLRFYFAAYPKAEDWDIMKGQTIDKEYAGKHTLVMVPTINRENLNFDFNPLNSGALKTTSTPKAAATVTSRVVEESLAQNHGQLIPPNDSSVELY
ncbi:hypothetical protein [Chryseobacterium sp.]|uniref:hypothetical protein n=1 Tax=Chryseobacterium sp. TaxID=1871047 RepID=UPI0025C3DA69|nr:hypothetical protein [Chryseobacterium sp.]